MTDILWIETRTYTSYDPIYNHNHPYFHLLYHIKGDGEISIDGNKHILTQKHMYITKPGEYHSFYAYKDSNLCTKEIKFISDDDIFKTLPDAIDGSGTPVHELLEHIQKELLLKESSYKEISAELLKVAMMYLKRTAEGGSSSISPDYEEEDEFSVVKAYIRSNIKNEITLEELAALVNLEKTYFLKKFSKVNGITPLKYVRNEKIIYAKNLLKYSDMNITQIADSMNFSSIHRFTEFFTRETGISPQKYKNQKINTILNKK